MSSTFQAVGFERLYIKGVLWDLATFKGEPGDDQTSSVSGPPGDAGQDGIFEFNTLNTTSMQTGVMLPDPSNVSYNSLYIKSNGVFLEKPTNAAIPVFNHQNNVVANLYNNGKAQSVRFLKNGSQWII
jgi:hypothetical protein